MFSQSRSDDNFENGSANISYSTLNVLLYLPKINKTDSGLDMFFKFGTGSYISKYSSGYAYTPNTPTVSYVNRFADDSTDDSPETVGISNKHNGHGTIRHSSFNVEKTIKVFASDTKDKLLKVRFSVYEDVVVKSNIENDYDDGYVLIDSASDMFKDISGF